MHLETLHEGGGGGGGGVCVGEGVGGCGRTRVLMPHSKRVLVHT